jgi:hypothetical protein
VHLPLFRTGLVFAVISAFLMAWTAWASRRARRAQEDLT